MQVNIQVLPVWQKSMVLGTALSSSRALLADTKLDDSFALELSEYQSLNIKDIVKLKYFLHDQLLEATKIANDTSQEQLINAFNAQHQKQLDNIIVKLGLHALKPSEKRKNWKKVFDGFRTSRLNRDENSNCETLSQSIQANNYEMVLLHIIDICLTRIVDTEQGQRLLNLFKQVRWHYPQSDMSCIRLLSHIASNIINDFDNSTIKTALHQLAQQKQALSDEENNVITLVTKQDQLFLTDQNQQQQTIYRSVLTVLEPYKDYQQKLIDKNFILSKLCNTVAALFTNTLQAKQAKGLVDAFFQRQQVKELFADQPLRFKVAASLVKFHQQQINSKDYRSPKIQLLCHHLMKYLANTEHELYVSDAITKTYQIMAKKPDIKLSPGILEDQNSNSYLYKLDRKTSDILTLNTWIDKLFSDNNHLLCQTLQQDLKGKAIFTTKEYHFHDELGIEQFFTQPYYQALLHSSSKNDSIDENTPLRLNK